MSGSKQTAKSLDEIMQERGLDPDDYFERRRPMPKFSPTAQESPRPIKITLERR